jgi:glucuronoarabinoxylan endo-1,4-beta-xylanase
VGDFLAPALGQLEHRVPIIAPESANWGSLERYSEALVAHEPALESILAFATHGYGRIAPSEQPAIQEVDGEIWQTEVSDPEQSRPDDGMGSAQRVARMIHADLTVGQVSAWHYWWLLPRGDVDDTNAALTNKGFELTRRAYALGHFSKFVRPGYLRLEATPSPAYLTFSSAFESPDGDEIVVVIASDRSLELVQEIHVPGTELRAAEMWVTDAERALVPLEPVSGAADAVTVVIPPKSIVTVILALSSE